METCDSKTERKRYRETGYRQGDGRQAWRRETVRQGDRDTGRQRYRETERLETDRGMVDRHVDVRQ